MSKKHSLRLCCVTNTIVSGAEVKQVECLQRWRYVMSGLHHTHINYWYQALVGLQTWHQHHSTQQPLPLLFKYWDNIDKATQSTFNDMSWWESCKWWGNPSHYSGFCKLLVSSKKIKKVLKWGFFFCFSRV